MWISKKEFNAMNQRVYELEVKVSRLRETDMYVRTLPAIISGEGGFRAATVTSVVWAILEHLGAEPGIVEATHTNASVALWKKPSPKRKAK